MPRDDRRKSTVEVKAFQDIGGDDTYEMPLQAFMTDLNLALEKIPAQHRSTAVFRIWGSGEYVSVYPEVRYTKFETDEEMAERHRKEDACRAQEAQEREAAERAMLDRLKQKYG